MDDITIRILNVSKVYPVYDRPKDRLKQFIVPRLKRLLRQSPVNYYREFWALKDISFEVKKGETIGVIGRNGSGKSTLLQIICGTTHPSQGSVETYGRMAALLELGSGFNMEFTGRENIYMNAAILGLTTNEINERFDNIISFADIGDFLDQPVKNYSSGMVVRLAFAVQSQVDPDILIVDEALAVGDAYFQSKCFERLRQLKEKGTSILLVTHSNEQIVTHCDQAILLDNGIQKEMGEPKYIVNQYCNLLFGRENKLFVSQEKQINEEETEVEENAQLSSSKDNFASRPGYNPYEYRWGDRSAAILDFHLSSNGRIYPSSAAFGEKITLLVSIRFYKNLYQPILGFTIKTKEGIIVYATNTKILELAQFNQMGQSDSLVHARLTFICRMAPGDYFISLGIASHQGEEIIPHDRRFDSIYLQMEPNKQAVGLINLELEITAKEMRSAKSASEFV